MASSKKSVGRRVKPRAASKAAAVASTEDPALSALGSRLGAEAYQFIGDLETHLERLFKALSSSTGIEAGRLREQLLTKLGLAKTMAASLRNGTLDQGRQYLTETARYVREQPWRAVGIGTAVGFTAGALLARRAAP
ncbi:MAG: hypothetical protein Q8Q73_17885 [Stagnimonas sp.]|nr:hypothetical protein [Stagnimonas sp.]